MANTLIAPKPATSQTVNVILDELTAKNLLLALTNALQAGSGKKKKGKKGGKTGTAKGLKPK